MQNLIERNIFEFSKQNIDINYIKPIKSGKEAEVHLVTYESDLYALKIYKKFTKYTTRLTYMNVDKIRGRTMKKAMIQKSRKGKGLTRSYWTTREFLIMKKLNKYNANVPRVLACTNDAILMEYFGTQDRPAPLLTKIELSQAEAENILLTIIKNIELFLELRIVHGDLCEYNILVWKKQPIIIDFPQFVDIDNVSVIEKYKKDIDNLKSYFRRFLGSKADELLDSIDVERTFVY